MDYVIVSSVNVFCFFFGVSCSLCLVQCGNRTSNGGVRYQLGMLLMTLILIVCLEFAC